MREYFRINKLSSGLIILMLVISLTAVGCRRISRAEVEVEDDAQDQVTEMQENLEIPVVTEGAVYEVELLQGITYGKGLTHSTWNSDDSSEMDLVLDLYQPIGAPENRPAMVLIHGGAFVIGTRTSAALVRQAEYYASRGFVVISIDYRLVGDYGTVPAEWSKLVEGLPTSARSNQLYAFYPAARDAKTAVRWLYAHAEEYQINTNYITVAGASAGAYTAVGIGATDPEDYRDELTLKEDPTLAECYMEWPSEVGTIIDYWGGSGLVNAIDLVYGKHSFDEFDPPIQIVHGDEDKVVEYSKSVELVKIYEEIGITYQLYTLKGEGHSAWDAIVDGKKLEQLAFDFIVEQQELQLWNR